MLMSIWLTCGVSSTSISVGGTTFVRGVFSEWSNALKYRKYDLDQYREEISNKVAESIVNFRRDQLVAQSVAQKDLESYMEKFNLLYAKNLKTMEKQKVAVNEMRRRMEISRPPKIDDSLEQFRRFYNESMIVGPYRMVSRSWKWNVMDKKSAKPQERIFEESLIKQSERLIEKFQSDWIHVFRSTTNQKGSQQKEGMIERAMRNAALDLSKLQDDLTSNARLLAVSTQNSIKLTIDKEDVRRETLNLEEQLKKLSSEGEVDLNRLHQCLFYLHVFSTVETSYRTAVTFHGIFHKTAQVSRISQLHSFSFLLCPYHIMAAILMMMNLYTMITGSLWVEEKISLMDSTLKVMQEKFTLTEKDFEDLLFRRKANIQYSSQNDASLNKVLNLIDPAAKGKR